MSLETGRIYSFGEFQINARTRTVRHHEAVLTLNRRAFDVLLYLVQNPGRAVTKEELLKNVWPDAYVDESSLKQSISVLRKALEEKPGENSYVVTLPGRGYQFISDVRVAAIENDGPEATLAPVRIGDSSGLVLQERTTQTRVITEATERTGAPQSRNRAVRWIAAALFVAVTSSAAYFTWKHSRPASTSIAVVLADFENATGDPTFGQVLNRALMIDLEQSPFLNLLSKSKIRETLKQMQRKSDEALTPALAREICERNNAQAMIHGTVSRIGSNYLLLLDAEGCATGQPLGGYKAAVSSKEALLGTLDKAAGRVRERLGEPDVTRERFRMPIVQATTSSLDALRAYSQAIVSFDRGDMKSAKSLVERAIELDPNFAVAYRTLGSCYYNLADFAQAAVWYRKAFDLRVRTSERERLGIEILYYGGGISDYEEAIRSAKLFNQIYPNEASVWANLCNLYTQLGEYPEATDAGQHAFRIDPRSGLAALVLSRALKRANRFTEAKAVANASVAAGSDHWGTHSILFQIAYAERDAAKTKSEGEWGLTHQNIELSLDDLGFAAATGGRLREAVDDFIRGSQEAARTGDAEGADAVLMDLVGVLIDLEEPARAATILKNIKAGDPQAMALAKAQLGDLAPAERLTAAADSTVERNTVHLCYDLPVLRSIVALKARKPEEAVRLLETARVYQLRAFRVLYTRARAEAEAAMLDDAARDYRVILDNQGIDPISPLYSLSHLRLARVLRLRGKLDQARAEYAAFFDACRGADADLPLLIQAKREYAALR